MESICFRAISGDNNLYNVYLFTEARVVTVYEALISM